MSLARLRLRLSHSSLSNDGLPLSASAAPGQTLANVIGALFRDSRTQNVLALTLHFCAEEAASLRRLHKGHPPTLVALRLLSACLCPLGAAG